MQSKTISLQYTSRTISSPRVRLCRIRVSLKPPFSRNNAVEVSETECYCGGTLQRSFTWQMINLRCIIPEGYVHQSRPANDLIKKPPARRVFN